MKQVEGTERPINEQQKTVSDIIMNDENLDANVQGVLNSLRDQVSDYAQRYAFVVSQNEMLKAEIKRLNQDK